MAGAQEVRGRVGGVALGEAWRGHIMHGLSIHGKDLEFYPKSGGKPPNGFQLGSAVMPFTVDKTHSVDRLAGEAE